LVVSGRKLKGSIIYRLEAKICQLMKNFRPTFGLLNPNPMRTASH
jgi:hypothetical protein